MATPLAPGPRPHPLVGNLPLLNVKHISDSYEPLHAEFGDTFSLAVGPIGRRRRVTVTRSPEAIGHVLGASSPFTKTGHPFFEAFRDIFGTGLFSAYDEDWRFQRRVLSPLFTAKRSAVYAPMMRKRTEEAVSRWSAEDGPVSLRHEVTRLTLEIITELLFGAGRDDLADRLEAHFGLVTQYIVDRAFRPMLPPRSVPLPWIRRREQAVAEVYRMVDEVMVGASAADDSFLGRLHEATDPETGRRFTSEEIRDQVLVFIAAGHDTTANAVTMALHLLGLHPAVQQDAADEVADTGAVEQASDADRLCYVTAVVDESLRLYPSAPGTGRVTHQDAEVDGYRVPARSAAYTNFWAVHRHPDLWDDPNAFIPQRFVDVPALKRPRHTYLPFGAGPRACIGAHTAILEMQTILSVVLARARVTAMTRHVPLRSSITLQVDGELPATITPR